MRKLLLALNVVLTVASSAAAQDAAKPLDLSSVAKEGSAPADFVPSGWKVEDTVKGDLNKDGRDDVALELVQAGGEDVERARALLVLLATDNGKLRLGGASNKVLYCTMCQGTMGGGSGGVLKIQKGVLLVDQLSGSRESTHTLLRFRYDAKEGRFVLIGQDVDNKDRLSGEGTGESTNLLTGQKITEKRQYDPKQDKDVVLSSKKEKAAVKKRYLEDVDIENLG